MKPRTTKLSLAVFPLILISGGIFWFVHTAQGVNRTWDGGGVDGTCGGAGTANNWSCAANWSGDVVPGASDVAIFDSTSTKDATINANISVQGISINAGYTGTITQSGSYTVTVGSSNYSQADGTFVGGSGNITINGPGTFILTGGSFTSTTGFLWFGGGFATHAVVFSVTGGTFNHNTGTVNFRTDGAYTFTIDVSGNPVFYNVINDIVKNFGVLTVSGGTALVLNDFTHIDGVLNGSWEIQGDAAFTDEPDGGSATIKYSGGNEQTFRHVAGNDPGGDITIEKTPGSTLTLISNATWNSTGQDVTIVSGALQNAQYSLSVDLLTLVNSSSVFTGGTGSVTCGRLTITDGVFSAPNPGILSIGRVNNNGENSFIYTNGTFAANFGTVTLTGGGNSTGDPFVIVNQHISEIVRFYNLRINGGTGTFSTSGDIEIEKNLNFGNGAYGGTWEFSGSDLTVESTADGGTATLLFTGGNNQTYTDQGGNEPNGDITINKTPGSSVTLKSNADWNASNQDLTITSGELNMGASSNLTTTALTIASAGELSNYGTGDLTLAGNVSNAGIVRFRSNGTCGGTDDILLRSSTNGVQRTWSGTGVYLFHDVDVRDMAGSAAITLYSSTNTANNGANWTFNGTCPAESPATNVQSGVINVQSGRWLVY